MRTSHIILAIALVAAVVAAVPARTCAADDATDVPPEIERAVARSLDYLARTQAADGSWPGNYGRCSGVVGLALLAFLAHGESPDHSKYAEVMRRAVDYIVSTQESNGLLAGREGGSPMYSHGFATLALAEVYGMIDDKRVGPALKKAVALIVSSQNTLGGWRYSVGSSDADTTVSGSIMMALRAAASAGVEVPEETVKRGVAYYKSQFCSGGGFGYTSPSGPNMARSGIGLLVLSLSGAYRSPEAKATADWIFDRMATESLGERFYYSSYYCSQALFQAGGKYWQRWNEIATPLIISRQAADGSWTAAEHGFCDVPFAILAIEVNYRLLPIYQR